MEHAGTKKLAQGMLCAHSGSELVTRDQLRQLPTPKVYGRWHRPIPHIDLVEAIQAALTRRHVDIVDEAFAVQTKGAKLFGVLQLESANGVFQGVDNSESGICLGLRSGNDQSFSLSINAGIRVFVCDNLAFSGATLCMRRRHTTGIRLREEVDEAIARYVVMTNNIQGDIDVARRTRITTTRAKVLLHDIFVQHILPMRFFGAASANFFKPTAEQVDCQGQTVWALHNALTRCARELPPGPKFKATVTLGRLLTDAPRFAAA